MLVDSNTCVGCGTCVGACPVNAISFDANGKAVIDQEICIHCGTCEGVCPVNAISH
ncbi:MAG: 4Fe-4S binding protein [Christensenellales bacterium]